MKCFLVNNGRNIQKNIKFIFLNIKMDTYGNRTFDLYFVSLFINNVKVLWQLK